MPLKIQGLSPQRRAHEETVADFLSKVAPSPTRARKEIDPAALANAAGPVRIGRTWCQALNRTPEEIIKDLPLPQLVDTGRLRGFITLSFDPSERQFLQATQVDGLPLRLVAPHLGWSPEKVEAVRKRIARKLPKVRRTAFADDFAPRGSSRMLSTREKIMGRRVAQPVSSNKPATRLGKNKRAA